MSNAELRAAQRETDDPRRDTTISVLDEREEVVVREEGENAIKRYAAKNSARERDGEHENDIRENPRSGPRALVKVKVPSAWDMYQ